MKMSVQTKNQRMLSLAVDGPLYELLSERAAANKESVSDLISGLLAESVKNWCDYCDSLRLLEMEDERVCVVDKPE